MGPLKKDPHGRGGRVGEGVGGAICCVLRGSEALRGSFVMFYKGLRLWEVHLYVFCVSGRFSGGPVSNDAMREGGSAKERPSRAWREGGGGGGRLDLSCFTRV